MTRLSRCAVLALTLLAIVPASLPALADSVASCRRETVIGPDGIRIDRVQAFADTIALQLRQRGYDVDYVEPWGGCVRAYIIDPGGGEHMAFFDPDTLEPLTSD